MSDEGTFAQGWHSQLGQPRSVLDKRPMHVKATSLASYLPLESHTTAPSSSGSRQKRTSGLSLFEAQRSWHQPVGVSQARAEHDTFRRGPLSSIDNTRANREAFSVNQVAELALQDYYHGKQDKLRADQATVVHEQQHEITCGPRINSTSHPRPIHTFSEEVIYPNMLDTRCGLVPRYSAPVGLEYSLRLPMAPFSYDAPRDSDTFAPKEKMLVSATLRVPHPTWDDSLRFQNKEHFMKPPPPPLPRRPKETYQYYHDSSSVPSEALKEPEMPIYELCAQDAEISEPLTMKQFGRISHQLPTASQFLCPKQNMMSTDSNVAKEAIGMDTLGTPKLAKLDTQKDRDDCYDRRNHKIPELDTSLSSKELRESQFVENLGQTSTRIDDSSKSRTSSYPKKANKGLEFDNFYTPANERFYNARPYTALNRNLKEIRLLRVFPKKPLGQHYKAHPKWVRNNAGELDRSKAVIACEIEKTSLTRIGDNFITLSYCAGDPRKTTLVLADGLPFNAFANLEHAMEKLAVHWALTHADGEPLLLWADQISINQSDKDERSNQVQIMRDIYRRSAQTYVCLSDPQVENCLSWTKKSGIIANTTKDPKGTLELQALLCNTLIGEENARHILPISPDPTLDKPCTDREEDLISQTLRTREDTQGIVGRHSFPVRFSELHRDRSFKRSPTLTRSLTRAQTIARHDADEVSLSPADFQSSLVAFITSRWWRRSWVYQEFLSANHIHFISGSTTVPWSELSPLVEFICDDVDAFMERLRQHVDSQITREMEEKNLEEREKERNVAREARRRQWRREQRQLQEENEARKRRQAERIKQQRLKEEAKRRDDTERQRIREDQERWQKYDIQTRNFEQEREWRWRAAHEAQVHEREKFHEQQLQTVQSEIHRLKNDTKATKIVTKPLKYWKDVRSLKELQVFKQEIVKPIDEQIKIALQTTWGNYDKVDEECGGRLFNRKRLQTLKHLNVVPDDPARFNAATLQPPQKPLPLPPVSTPCFGSQSGLNSSLSEPAIAARRAWEYSSNTTSSKTVEPMIAEIDTGVSDVIDNDEYELPEEDDDQKEDILSQQQEAIIQRNGDHRKIEQRERIIRLQDDLHHLDRSALVSIVKGRKGYLQHRSPDLIELLQHSRNCAASDPRDRIYAFIGLAESTYNIIPDYDSHNTVEKVLTETAKRIICHDKSLVILQHANRGRTNLGTQLPSWVPDWTSKEATRGIDHGYDWENTKPFCAAKDTAAITEFQDHPATDGEVYVFLKASAILVGTIMDIQQEECLEHISSITLSRGESAFGPRATRHGDQIWILYGANRPAALRPEGDNRFGYLGDVIVVDPDLSTFSSIMYGELVDRALQGLGQVEDIWIT